jgi:hypothetical protein
MNKGKIETVGVDAFLVTFWAHKKPPADEIRGQPESSIIMSYHRLQRYNINPHAYRLSPHA